jgi:hypothetical protein
MGDLLLLVIRGLRRIVITDKKRVIGFLSSTCLLKLILVKPHTTELCTIVFKKRITMIAQKRYGLLLIAFVCVSMTAYAKQKKPSGKSCQDEDSCLMDPKCKCYCSEIGGFRKKNASDSPIYVKGDPRGKYCYCKQWDWDNYPKAERPETEEKNKSFGKKKSKKTSGQRRCGSAPY